MIIGELRLPFYFQGDEMKYKVLNTCFDDGIMYEEGSIVEFPKEKPVSRHFQPLEEVKEVVAPIPHRTEPMTMEDGKKRNLVGGFGKSVENQKIDRIMTTDKVPNNVPKDIKKKRPARKKGAGSVKKSN
jgi:hypothetical protein